MSSQIIYLDGNYVPEDEAKVSVFDHGLLYGDGIFEGIRAYNGKIFKCKEHIDRLYRSAELLEFEIDITKEQFIQDVQETVKSSGYKDAYIRITVSVQAYIDLSTPEYTINRVIIILDDDVIPEEKYQKGIHLVEVKRRRTPEAALPMRAKTLNYLNNILALKEAHKNGGDDCVLLNIDGYVSEGSAANIFFVKDGVLTTPHPDAGLLVGITRNTILDLAPSLGLETKESLFGIEELLSADEVFLTGTAYEIMPVRKVYGTDFKAPGDYTAKLMKLYQETVNQ